MIEILRNQEVKTQAEPNRLFKSGERVILNDGAFVGLEAIYQMADGDQWVIVLIELMNQSVTMKIAPASQQWVG